MSAGTCRVCACTDDDCSGCIERTGEPCCWIEPDLCSACSPGVELRCKLDEMVARGDCSKAEADEAYRFFDDLSERELRGEISMADAMAKIDEFGREQVARRRMS